MALRSLAGKVGNRLVRWATRDSPPPPPPPAAASEMNMFLKDIKPGSSEAKALAMDLKSKEYIRKCARNAKIMAAATFGILWFFWFKTKVSSDEAMDAKMQREVNLAFAEAVDAQMQLLMCRALRDAAVERALKDDAVDADEGKTVDSKEGKTVD